ncbi:AN1-type zinc finger domain-containing protein [Methanocella arvoryzae]|uniref:AN1-type domain-containing protein n=1 Tax=Methanocella arvoryzae (strain DSM 22066 / NBRC 105507 / MRE50) TaxID=351160 RepID=Q0W7W6_METAR|nr:AN1-type zinc finger protein [Methanocella arvoryzae]CAJ35527.1 hypothetical protein RCIA1 [Methanocella arvoryzae MRE50]
MIKNGVYCCDICGETEPLLFTCKRCGGKYCGEHRLPEKHDCSSVIREFSVIEEPPIIERLPTMEEAPHTQNIPSISNYNNTNNQISFEKKISKKPYKPKRYRRRFNFNLSRSIRTILNSNLYSAILVVIVVAILGLGYYEFIYDPNTVELSYQVGNTHYYETNSTGAYMYIHNNPNATNPSYQELINFVLTDNSDQIPYREESFV